MTRIIGNQKVIDICKKFQGDLKKINETNKYKIQIKSYDTGPNKWHYSSATLFNKNGNELVTVYRNYPAFEYTIIEDHPDGHDYLVCSTHYQGQTIICLDDDWSFDTEKYLNGFCCTEYIVSESKMYIKIIGCYWAGPYEELIVDFTQPREVPLKMLACGDNEDCVETNWDVGMDEDGKFYDKIYLTKDDDSLNKFVLEEWRGSYKWSRNL